MANPRQRRKARSSSHKPVSHSRHAKRNLKKTPPIRGPRLLQEAWDKKKTVRQNYLALGLVHDLNPSASGGAEPSEAGRASGLSPEVESTLPASQVSTSKPSIPKGYGKIIRDEFGNVLRVELAEEDPTEDADGETMADVESEMDGVILDKWVTNLGGNHGKVGQGHDLVEALESISATNITSTSLSVPISGVGPRYASSGEIFYLERLVDKYGQDVEKMARDRKLNYEQRTAGDLRRSLRRAGLVLDDKRS